MTWEPAAAIVAVAAVTGVAFPAVANATPDQAPETQPVPAALQSAPQLVEPVNSIVALLPPDMRQQAASDLVRAIPALEAPKPAVPEASPTEAPTPEAAAPEPAPPVAAAPAPAPVVSAPVAVADTAPAITLPGVGSLTLPTLPAILPTTNLGQVGAIAVFAPWLRQAGEICGGVKAPTLAALFSVENDFRYGPTAPVSLAGGRGPAKFMPSEWAKYGKDADGDGNAGILGVADSVMAAGHMLCDNFAQVEAWKNEGLVQGDTLDLALAAFNAGARAVRKAGGVPSGVDDAADQSGPYIQKIRASEGQFEQLLSPFANFNLDINLPTTGIGGAIVQLAMRYLGLPYVWGGGNISGPTAGGFDCSGLTSYAIFAASGGKVVLPRTSETQWGVGTEIPMAAAQPGDLVFGNWQAGGPGHVGIYMGNGMMVHAPTFGDVVKVGPVFDGMKARRVLA
ncbi:bifunctional lytic transglycosylase/C40 family peptidase [Prescottella equi]|uniref:Lytic transglycosylase n=1 Tax=Rhodococcus hoagii TaxID=43767 RepID=A0A9Q5F2G1_RHOHA|nr:bifunctional lytic transglycosylase/C40 family peptidase [Prescottella equi]MBM4486803.1 lytic transglycosylase [Prescottella equi]MBM4495943.1 lytic transglycosylase [Prescottella equi]MBM4500297.1 lytic transglycosylase [Prescottella equi]MBM4505485.1 lytic transglycosylase [Prescottella equi]MBM4512999.1 lytic transglycosylase [Prescottella equi]